MTASKPTSPSTALARILALPLMAGALVACDYASRLPDAPSQLGYELADKPASVTDPRVPGAQAQKLPPPEDSFAKLDAPVEYRTAAETADGLLAPDDFKTPRLAVPPAAPELAGVSTDFAPLEFESVESGTEQVDSADFAAPTLDMAATMPKTFVKPPSVTQGAVPGADAAPAPFEPLQIAEPVRIEPVVGKALPPVLTDAAPVETSREFVTAPELPSYTVPAPVQQDVAVATPAPAPAPEAGFSPIAILHTRLANGAVVNVHPVIGAPGTASSAIGRSIVESLGTRVTQHDANYAHVTFELRGRAERNTEGYANINWTLTDRYGAVVGVFDERHDGGGFSQVGDDVLNAMGRRVADRIDRNPELRRATLYAAADAPSIAAAPVTTAPKTVKRRRVIAQAPIPRPSPRRKATTFSAPKQVAQTAPAPKQTVAVAPPPKLATPSLPSAPQPRTVTAAPAPKVQAPRTVASAPAPSFDTLRAGNTEAGSAPAVAAGPRPLVFQGVQGAPGDGDVSLSREVAKLLAQSGARVTSSGGPEALYLTAQVSKTPSANADRIQIVWKVQDASGNAIGEVTQANDVPRGALDQNWGEDAFYAAEGAKNGIMELLQSSGAFDS